MKLQSLIMLVLLLVTSGGRIDAAFGKMGKFIRPGGGSVGYQPLRPGVSFQPPISRAPESVSQLFMQAMEGGQLGEVSKQKASREFDTFVYPYLKKSNIAVPRELDKRQNISFEAKMRWLHSPEGQQFLNQLQRQELQTPAAQLEQMWRLKEQFNPMSKEEMADIAAEIVRRQKEEQVAQDLQELEARAQQEKEEKEAEGIVLGGSAVEEMLKAAKERQAAAERQKESQKPAAEPAQESGSESEPIEEIIPQPIEQVEKEFEAVPESFEVQPTRQLKVSIKEVLDVLAGKETNQLAVQTSRSFLKYVQSFTKKGYQPYVLIGFDLTKQMQEYPLGDAVLVWDLLRVGRENIPITLMGVQSSAVPTVPLLEAPAAVQDEMVVQDIAPEQLITIFVNPLFGKLIPFVTQGLYTLPRYHNFPPCTFRVAPVTQDRLFKALQQIAAGVQIQPKQPLLIEQESRDQKLAREQRNRQEQEHVQAQELAARSETVSQEGQAYEQLQQRMDREKNALKALQTEQEALEQEQKALEQEKKERLESSLEIEPDQEGQPEEPEFASVEELKQERTAFELAEEERRRKERQEQKAFSQAAEESVMEREDLFAQLQQLREQFNALRQKYDQLQTDVQEKNRQIAVYKKNEIELSQNQKRLDLEKQQLEAATPMMLEMEKNKYAVALEQVAQQADERAQELETQLNQARQAIEQVVSDAEAQKNELQEAQAQQKAQFAVQLEQMQTERQQMFGELQTIREQLAAVELEKQALQQAHEQQLQEQAQAQQQALDQLRERFGLQEKEYSAAVAQQKDENTRLQQDLNAQLAAAQTTAKNINELEEKVRALLAQEDGSVQSMREIEIAVSGQRETMNQFETKFSEVQQALEKALRAQQEERGKTGQERAAQAQLATELSEQVARAQREFQEVAARYDLLEVTLNLEKQKRVATEQQRAALEAQLAQKTEAHAGELQELQQQIQDVLQKEASALQESSKAVARLQGTIAVQQQQVENQKQENMRLKSELEALRKELSDVQQKQAQDISDNEEKIRALTGELQDAQREVIRMQAALDTEQRERVQDRQIFEQEINKYQGDLAVLREQKDEIVKNKDRTIVALRKSTSSLQDALKQAQQEKEHLEQAEQQAKAELQKSSREVDAVRGLVKMREKRIKEQQQELQQLSQEKEQEKDRLEQQAQVTKEAHDREMNQLRMQLEATELRIKKEMQEGFDAELARQKQAFERIKQEQFVAYQQEKERLEQAESRIKIELEKAQKERDAANQLRGEQAQEFAAVIKKRDQESELYKQQVEQEVRELTEQNAVLVQRSSQQEALVKKLQDDQRIRDEQAAKQAKEIVDRDALLKKQQEYIAQLQETYDVELEKLRAFMQATEANVAAQLDQAKTAFVGLQNEKAAVEQRMQSDQLVVNRERAELTNQIQTLQASIARLEQQLVQLRQKKETQESRAVQTELDVMDKNIERIRTQLVDTRDFVQQYWQRRADLKAEQERFARVVTNQDAVVKSTVKQLDTTYNTLVVAERNVSASASAVVPVDVPTLSQVHILPAPKPSNEGTILLEKPKEQDIKKDKKIKDRAPQPPKIEKESVLPKMPHAFEPKKADRQRPNLGPNVSPVVRPVSGGGAPIVPPSKKKEQYPDDTVWKSQPKDKALSQDISFNKKPYIPPIREDTEVDDFDESELDEQVEKEPDTTKNVSTADSPEQTEIVTPKDENPAALSNGPVSEVKPDVAGNQREPSADDRERGGLQSREPSESKVTPDRSGGTGAPLADNGLESEGGQAGGDGYGSFGQPGAFFAWWMWILLLLGLLACAWKMRHYFI